MTFETRRGHDEQQEANVLWALFVISIVLWLLGFRARESWHLKVEDVVSSCLLRFMPAPETNLERLAQKDG